MCYLYLIGYLKQCISMIRSTLCTEFFCMVFLRIRPALPCPLTLIQRIEVCSQVYSRSWFSNLFKIFCTQLLWEKCMHYTHRISKPKQCFASPRSFIANERPRVSLISASFCLSLEKIKISYIRTKLVYIKTWICSRRRKFAAFYRVRRANALAD